MAHVLPDERDHARDERLAVGGGVALLRLLHHRGELVGRQPPERTLVSGSQRRVQLSLAQQTQNGKSGSPDESTSSNGRCNRRGPENQ